MEKIRIIQEYGSFDNLKNYDYAIIITSYGRDILLEKALNSAVNQKYKTAILIIDDNSDTINKKTKQIILNLASKNDNILFFSTKTSNEERKKVSTFCRNINFMLKICIDNLPNIKYVSYLPCDDIYHPTRTSLAIRYLRSNDSISSCYNYIDLVSIGGQKIGKIPGTLNKSIINAVAVLDHSCVTHKIELLNKMEYPYWPISKNSEHIAPDGEFFNKLIAVGGPIFKISGIVLGEKLHHGNSIQGKAHGW
jgi:glycosyltransferase involved in cell wall biosynthesis